MKKNKKTCYIKPEVHVHWLIVESEILGGTKNSDWETEEAFSRRQDHIIEDDEDEEDY